MAETFYSTLGVGPDADASAVESAYRDLVKEHHPDVSDDPGASRTFKRLTTARDVLLDEAERARYDRMGHERYVRAHVDTPVWAGGDADDSASDRRDDPTPEEPAGTSADRTSWFEENAGGQAAGEGVTRGRQSGRQTAGSPGADADQPWQSASATYQRSAAASAAAATTGTGRSATEVLRSIGPWLPVHAVLLASAGATTWVWLSQAERVTASPWPVYLGGVALVGLVLVASVLHLVSRVYA